MLGELNDTQISNLLSSQVVGRLACTDGEKPYIVPVTYTYDGEYIYGQTNIGKKLKLLRKNPNVCFEVDKMMNVRNWQSVIVQGKFEELKNKDVDKGRAILFDRVFSMLTSTTVHTHEHAVTTVLEDSNRVKYIMYRIKIKKLTGRYETE
ncbi:MAG: pyridoxamine 5'-phosphate oxidase family protein [Ferruginibacter sp.]|nr:pyridoxamine 5'-phosphate oxidase family protein [Ferruginibacter sp.]